MNRFANTKPLAGGFLPVHLLTRQTFIKHILCAQSHGDLEVDTARFLRKGLVILPGCGQTAALCLRAEDFQREAAPGSAQPRDDRWDFTPGCLVPAIPP